MSFAALRFANISRPGAQHRRSFAFSVAAAFGLNLLALCGLAVAVAPWREPRRAAVDDIARVAAIVLAPPRAVAEPPTPPQAPKRTAATRTAAPEVLGAAGQGPLPAGSVNATGSLTRFYRSDEVDLPAEPDSDWNLDAMTLAATGLDALVFDIFIGRDGEVIACTIVEPQVSPAELRDALEWRLRQTVLRPALKEGKPVASVRRIEVSVL